MDDDWAFPAPQEDPEVYKAGAPGGGGGGGGCPHLEPDRNFVEGEIDDEAPPSDAPQPP
jgi:hypothetical protein